MPLRGFICPAWTETAGQHNPFTTLSPYVPAACLGCDKTCMDIAFLAMIARDTCENVHVGDYLSVSGLAAPRATWLERKVDYYEKPADCWPRTKGGGIHRNLEDIIATLPNFEDYLLESSFLWNLEIGNGIILVNMRIDRYNKKKKLLTDYKTMHDNGWKMLKDGPKQDHVMQANCYRMGLEQNGHKVDKISINYITMKFTREFWDVQIIPDDIVLRYAKPRASQLFYSFQNDCLPPICNEETRKWKCPTEKKKGYCSVGFACPDCELYKGGFKHGK